LACLLPQQRTFRAMFSFFLSLVIGFTSSALVPRSLVLARPMKPSGFFLCTLIVPFFLERPILFLLSYRFLPLGVFVWTRSSPSTSSFLPCFALCRIQSIPGVSLLCPVAFFPDLHRKRPALVGSWLGLLLRRPPSTSFTFGHPFAGRAFISGPLFLSRRQGSSRLFSPVRKV